MYTVKLSGPTCYFVRSPGGRVVDTFPYNATIPNAHERARNEACKLRDRMNELVVKRMVA